MLFLFLSMGCTTPNGTTNNNFDLDDDGYFRDDDCDDSNPNVNPGEDEVCDELDNDCDEWIDESGSLGENNWYMDVDGDGWGSSTPPSGIAAGRDCDDNDANMTLDDRDGDGLSSCEGDCDDLDGLMNHKDADLDNYSTCEGDCDDDDSNRSPIASEICDGTDNDCNGITDDELLGSGAL